MWHNLINKVYFVLAIIVACCFSQALFSQEMILTEGDSVRIETIEGNILTGVISSVSDDFLELKTNFTGVIRIGLESIRNIESLDGRTKHSSQDLDPDIHNSTHLFVAPTGYGLQKGQSYYQNILVFGNSFSYGITNYFSVSGGGEIASLLFSSNFPVLYISPKFSVPVSGDVAVSLGGIFFTSPEDDFNGIGLAYTALSFGNRNNNFTIGGALGFTTDSGFDDHASTVTIGGMLRISQKLSVVSDNWILIDEGETFGGLISLGLRIYTKGVTTVDVGLARPTDVDGDFLAIPFVDVVVPLR